MEQALAHWRRSYHVGDNAFESLIGIISTHGPQQILSAGNGALSSLQGVPPNISSHYFTGSEFSDTSGATRAPLITTTESLFLEPHLDAMPVQDMVVEGNPFMGYVSPSQASPAAELTNNIVSEIVEDFPQSLVAASREPHLRSCVNCWTAKKKVTYQLATGYD